jgi:hypothetical protein
VASEAATYHRIRSAISAAKETGEVTVLSGSTELSAPAAAEYAKNYMAMEGMHGVGVSVAVGTLEIGPAAEPAPKVGTERRGGGDRRSGGERRKAPPGKAPSAE